MCVCVCVCVCGDVNNPTVLCVTHLPLLFGCVHLQNWSVLTLINLISVGGFLSPLPVSPSPPNLYLINAQQHVQLGRGAYMK